MMGLGLQLCLFMIQKFTPPKAARVFSSRVPRGPWPIMASVPAIRLDKGLKISKDWFRHCNREGSLDL